MSLELTRLMPCLCCGSKSDPHHIKTRGAGGGDEQSNLMPLCRVHHTEIHSIGTGSMAVKYPAVKSYLEANGWEFALGKWRRYN